MVVAVLGVAKGERPRATDAAAGVVPTGVAMFACARAWRLRLLKGDPAQFASRHVSMRRDEQAQSSSRRPR
jgi:hypothetical protein